MGVENVGHSVCVGDNDICLPAIVLEHIELRLSPVQAVFGLGVQEMERRRIMGCVSPIPDLIDALEDPVPGVANHPGAVEGQVGDLLPGPVTDNDRIPAPRGLVPSAADVLDGFDDQVVDEDLLGMTDVQHRGFVVHLGFSCSSSATSTPRRSSAVIGRPKSSP